MRFLVPTAPVAIQGLLGLGAGGVAADDLHAELAGQRPPVEVEPDEDVVELHGGSPARGRAARFSPPGDRVAATHGVRRRVKGGRTAGPKDASPLRRRRGAVGSAGRPRERPVRGRVQGPGRGAEGEAVPSLAWRGNETGPMQDMPALLVRISCLRLNGEYAWPGTDGGQAGSKTASAGAGCEGEATRACRPSACGRAARTRGRGSGAPGPSQPRPSGSSTSTARSRAVRAGACRANPCRPPAALVRMVVEETLGEAS